MAGEFHGRRMPHTYERVPVPKNMKDVPRYLKQVIGGFFVRFAYIVKIVWKTGHWILFMLSFIALFKGLTPVIGALISQGILNELQQVIKIGGLSKNSFWSSAVFYLLIGLFVYRIILEIINCVSRALNRIAGEKVVNQVKLQIMEKSKELDLALFDESLFYEKMENASREAGNRPLMILTETFGAISTVIELISYLIILFTAPGLTLVT